MGKKKLEIRLDELNKILADGNKWILKSGIQANSIKNKGGYYAWINSRTKNYSYIYSEITGYLLTYNCFIYSEIKNKTNLKAAELAADWLINKSQKPFGGFKCLELVDKNLSIVDKSNFSYSFDNGVILNGLINLYKIKKKKKYLNSAIKCADWIIKCSNSNGLVKPLYDFKNKIFIENQKSWSMLSGSYHAKIAIGLFNIYSIIKRKKYLKLAKKIINQSIKIQFRNGMFPSTKFHTNLHPHCYSAEGIWVAAKLNNKITLFNSVISAVNWIKKNMKGNVPARLFFFKKKRIYNYRVDSISQFLRLLILLKSDNKIILENSLVQNLFSILKKNSSRSNLKIFKGGFFWGYNSNGKKNYGINIWTTIFILQTILYFKNMKKKKKINPFHII